MGKKEDYTQQQLASTWNYKFKDAMVSKAEYTKKWQTYEDAYRGDYFKNDKLPDYRSNMVSNYIFSTIETIRPIMLDNDPKFQSMPRQPDGMEFSKDLQECFMYEWDREKVNLKLYRELINTLVLGTSIFFVPWDSENKNVKAVPVSPYNIFPDPLATSIEDAEYIIYASYKNSEVLRRSFPDKADKLFGSDVNYSELVKDNDKNSKIDNQILVLEVWTRDYETTGGSQSDSKGKNKIKHPNGRVITLCPELGIVLSDKDNPYQDGKFPFVLMKDYDIPGKFWGEGEVAQLLSPQKYMNELNNAIIDNAKSTANMPWIVDKNSGIGQGKITSRPGLILRKNPGSEVRREQPPSMPMYVADAVEKYKMDIEQVSGIFSSIKGDSTTGVYTAQGILSLQEAGQTRIRLKVKLLEEALSTMAELWYSRMKQFWKEDRWVQISKYDGSYDLKKFTKDALKHDYDIKVMAGSTMPVNKGAMLDLMTRLAQTQMPDGQSLVDREAVVQYLPQEVRSAILDRMKGQQSSLAEIEGAIQESQQMMQQLGQQLQQVAQESSQADDETFGVIEEITSSIEDLNKKILQLQEEHDRIEKEREEEEKEYQLKTDSYNQGYTDAEKYLTSEMNGSDEPIPVSEQESPLQGENEIDNTTLEKGTSGEDGVNELEGVNDAEGVSEGIPEELLLELEDMSDEELAELTEKYPEILDMI